jgi:hypothetical protein
MTNHGVVIHEVIHQGGHRYRIVGCAITLHAHNITVQVVRSLFKKIVDAFCILTP